tara:strand:+ start:50 stop:364 length:315 start_codon:yes stop_codon:yes gene_type:complete
MKLVKTFFIIIMILFMVYFLSMNNSKADIDLLFKKFFNVSISMIIFTVLSIGIFLGYLLAVFSVLSSKAKNRTLQNKIKSLSDELNDLRNVAVEESIFEKDVMN